MFSRFFIDRPVFASVISILITIAGLVAMQVLPVAQYPEILPPSVVVTANYSGASAETIAETIAAPLEQQINGVDGMIYLQSTSADSGVMQLTITFDIGTDPDQATIDVNNRVQAALPLLPEEVRQQGVRVDKRSTAILGVVALHSPDGRHDPVFISNYALLNVIDELKRTPGIGDAALFGAKDYSMRIWLEPDKLAEYELTPSDVAAAVREQNAQSAAGKFGAEPNTGSQPFTYTVTTQGRFVTAEQFEQIILRANPDGSALRLRDVARIELGARDYSFNGTFNNRQAVPIGLYLQPGANAIETLERANQALEQLAERFPEGLTYDIPFDTTVFVSQSINEVIKTFIEALLLVVAVVFLFLQNWRATLIPVLAVPVSVIGTFTGMYLLGFSINMLTLFGLVLAIGIVVDDAIVVLENVERIMREQRKSPKDAAIQAMQEVTGPVISIVLVLCAVFVPVAFLGGMAGQMYQQFAITIALSVIISGIVALTLSPALCAALLKPGHQEPAKPLQLFNRWFESVTNGYTRGVQLLLKRSAIGLLLFGGLIVLSAALLKQLPTALVPQEDQGYLIAASQLPAAASLERTTRYTGELTETILAQPEVDNVITFAGFDVLAGALKSYAGVSFVNLKPWAEREASAEAMAGRVFEAAEALPQGATMTFTPPPITGISTTGGFELFLQSRAGGSVAELAEMAHKLAAAASAHPAIGKIESTLDTHVPRFHADVDRERAKALNVPIDRVYETMQSTFGSLYVNDFSLFGRNYRVYLQSEAEFRQQPDDLGKVYVRANSGGMVPLSALVKVERSSGADVVERFNVFPAAKLHGEPAPGQSSGQAIAALQAIADEMLPADYELGWVGTAYQEQRTGDTTRIALLFGLLVVFLILAAQYENFALPLAIVAAVPFALFGAVVAVWMRGLENDLYFQIGLLVLIGLAAKNAILIVEFAVLQRRAGLGVVEAALSAARLRFRPIVMTSLAFILGCVPLAIGSGAGAASRHSIGTGVIGGMLGATILAIFFVPMFYMLIERLQQRLRRQPAGN